MNDDDATVRAYSRLQPLLTPQGIRYTISPEDAKRMTETFKEVREAVLRFGSSVNAALQPLRDAAAQMPDEEPDLRGRALEARRNRHTGPPVAPYRRRGR